MSHFDFGRDRMTTASDAIVASRVLAALNAPPMDQMEEEEDRRFLLHGQQLLELIASSSMLVSDIPSTGGLVPSTGGLEVLGAARSAMLQLQAAGSASPVVSEYFLNLRDALRDRIEGKATGEEISHLRSFFEKLRAVLAEDSASYVYPRPR